MRSSLLPVAGVIALISCLDYPHSLARTPAADSTSYYVYMSAKGDDRNPGSIERPVLSLGRVHEILERERPERDVIVKIRSDQGVYVNQSVLWSYYIKGRSITVESDPPSAHACFIADDNPPQDPFFTLRAAHGEATNLVLKGLTVRNYVSRAILFQGDEGARSKWNGFNSIEDCVFEDIGNARMPAKPIAYSVIGLINSRNNRIVNCRFINIMNHTVANYPQKDQRPDNPIVGIGDDHGKPGGHYGGNNPNIPIIAVYIAHHSDSNQVAACKFRRVKGDAIRIRDDSNGNSISKNLFELAGWHAVISTWYCSGSIEGCSEKLEAEVPSRGNIFKDNKANGNWKGGKPTVYCDLVPASEISGISDRPGVILKNNASNPYMRRLVQ